MRKAEPALALKAWRRRRALSQKDLADAAGVRRATIAEIESGRRAPRPSTIRKLAGALELQPEDLFQHPGEGGGIRRSKKAQG